MSRVSLGERNSWNQSGIYASNHTEKTGVFPYRPDVGLETEPITSRIRWALSADSRQRSAPGQGLVPSLAGNSQTHRALTTCSRKNVQAAFTRLPRLNPTIRPFAGQRIKNKPGDGGPGGLPKGEAQGIPEKPAAFTGAGGRQISRGNANTLADQGDVVESHLLLRIGLVISTFLRSQVCFCAVRAVGCPMGE